MHPTRLHPRRPSSPRLSWNSRPILVPRRPGNQARPPVDCPRSQSPLRPLVRPPTGIRIRPAGTSSAIGMAPTGPITSRRPGSRASTRSPVTVRPPALAARSPRGRRPREPRRRPRLKPIRSPPRHQSRPWGRCRASIHRVCRGSRRAMSQSLRPTKGPDPKRRTPLSRRPQRHRGLTMHRCHHSPRRVLSRLPSRPPGIPPTPRRVLFRGWSPGASRRRVLFRGWSPGASRRRVLFRGWSPGASRRRVLFRGWRPGASPLSPRLTRCPVSWRRVGRGSATPIRRLRPRRHPAGQPLTGTPTRRADTSSATGTARSGPNTPAAAGRRSSIRSDTRGCRRRVETGAVA